MQEKERAPGQSRTEDHQKYGLHFLYLGFKKLQGSQKLKTSKENEHCFSFSLMKKTESLANLPMRVSLHFWSVETQKNKQIRLGSTERVRPTTVIML